MKRSQLLALVFVAALQVAVAPALCGQPEPSSGESSLKVAAISFKPSKLDLERNADTLEAAFRKAAEKGARIALAPEGVLDGYVINDILAGKVTADQLRQVSLSVDGPVIRRFRELAAELKVCLAFGFAERVGEELFNCAIFLDDSGRIAGKYHKMQFAEGYDPSWWWNRLGRQSRAFDTPYGRAGFMICNDRWNADLARIPVLDGARFLLIPAFGSRSQAQDDAVRSRARENGVPVIEANVGVTLIVDGKGNLIGQGRDEIGITFGEIRIPAPVKPRASARDRIEAEFLRWRGAEMPRRYQKRKG